MKFLLFFTFCAIVSISFAQRSASALWQKSYGGSANDEAQGIQQTPDGGFIIAGTSQSNDGDVTGNHGYSDIWVTKTDHSGQIQWQKSYGGYWFDYAKSVLLTPDGGYLIAGNTFSNDGNATGGHGSLDYFLLKIDSVGTVQWHRCYGGSGEDELGCIEPIKGGGFILGGLSTSTDGDLLGNHGNMGIWVVRINSTGGIIWNKVLTGILGEHAFCIRQTYDHNYILAGAAANLNGGSGGTQYDYWDLLIVKFDLIGTVKWHKTYGGNSQDCAKGIIQTADSGFVIGGYTYSTDGDVTGNHGGADFWMIKTNVTGDMIWQKTYGGSGDDITTGFDVTAGGDYFLYGSTSSSDDNVNGNHGEGDYWLFTTDTLGVMDWQKCYGGSGADIANCVSQTTDGDFVAAGSSGSVDGDITNPHGNNDFWILRTCYIDPISASISDSVYCYTTQLIAPEGFAHYVWNTGDTTRVIETGTGGTYNVVVTSDAGCTSSAEITVPEPVQVYQGQQICLVTYDETTGKNVVVYMKKLDVNTDSILIYRLEQTSGQYQKIGASGINEISVYADTDGAPGLESYDYRISVKDKLCGKESGLSSTHRTILLQALDTETGQVSLSWNPYEGAEYSNHLILRSNAGAPFTEIGNVSAATLTFTDDSPPPGTNRYQISAPLEKVCSPSRSSFSSVSSNIAIPVTIGISEDPNAGISVFPNPAGEFLNIKAGPGFEGCAFRLTDETGRTVLSGILNPEIKVLSLSGLGSGVYILHAGNKKPFLIKVLKR